MKTLLAVVLCCAFGFEFCGWATDASATKTGGTSSGFDRLVDRYFDSFFKFHPTDGTDAGFHEYDKQLESFSPKAIHAEISKLRDFQTQFGHFQQSYLSAQERGDFEYLENTIRARLLEIEAVQSW